MIELARRQRRRDDRTTMFEDRHTVTEPLVEPQLAAALSTLSKRQRQAVVLIAGYRLSHAETAELLGISRSSVQNHLERGMAALRTALGAST